MGRQYHIKCSPGDVAEYVLLPGDPGRVPKIAALWDRAEKVAENREYVTYTGTVRGTRISCCSTGIGGPSTAIAVEELARCGAQTFIRVGTAGGLPDDANVGDLAIISGSVRMEGTTKTYVIPEYPAFADHEVLLALIEAASQLGYRFHVGVARTGDAFYSQRPEPGSFREYWQSSMRGVLEDLKRARVICVEMESSVILTLTRLFGLRAGAVCAIIDRSLEPGSGGTFDPESTFQPREEYITGAARVAVEAVKILRERDETKRKSGAAYWHPSLK